MGASNELGHKLRSPVRERPPAGAWTDTDVLIVGGGVAGLSAAWRLDHAGLGDFVLLELEEALGGTSVSGRSDLVAYPWGAHYLPLPRKENRSLIRLLEELGVLEGSDAEGEPVGGEQFLCRDPDERLFHDGAWREGIFPWAGATSGDLRQLGELEADVGRWVGWRDARGRRAFDLPLDSSSDDAEPRALDRISMAEYLERRGLSSPRLRWYVNYCTRDDYGTRVEETSAWAGLFYFCSRMRSPGREPQPLLVWPEGNGRLVDHLARRAGARARAGWMATNIVPSGPPGGAVQGSAVQGGAAGEPGLPGGPPRGGAVEVWAMNRRGQLAGFRARRVIFSAPIFLCRFVLAPFRESSPPHLGAFEYAPWLVANLHLRDRPRERGFPLAWDNVIQDSPGLGYVVATHQTELDRGPTVFTYYHALSDEPAAAARARLEATGRDGWAESILRDLEAAHPDLRDLTDRIDIMLWGHAMVRPRVGLIWGDARRKAREPVCGVHFAHTDLSGLALFEEAFQHGLRAAEEVLAALGRPVREPWAAPG